MNHWWSIETQKKKTYLSVCLFVCSKGAQESSSAYYEEVGYTGYPVASSELTAAGASESLSLFFRYCAPDGLLLYATDQSGSLYLALGISSNHLLLEFDTGEGKQQVSWLIILCFFAHALCVHQGYSTLHSISDQVKYRNVVLFSVWLFLLPLNLIMQSFEDRMWRFYGAKVKVECWQLLCVVNLDCILSIFLLTV